MTAGKVMLIICVVAFIIGTIGLVRSLIEKSRQRKQEKHYADMRKASDNG